MAPSTREWNQDLVCPNPEDHIVHLYFRKEELVRAVAYYAATGIELGEAVVLVMKPEHWRATRAELELLGIDPEARLASRELIVADAQSMLESFLVDGSPERRAFADVIAAIFGSARPARSGSRIRVYGEMVQTLRDAGRDLAAEELEGLWNEVLKSTHATLLCGYQLSLDPFPSQLLAAHNKVLNFPSERDRILHAAREFLGRHEVDRIPIAMVAQAARVAIDAVESEFGDDAGLTRDVQELWWREVEERAAATPRGHENRAQRALEVLDYLFDVARDHRPLTRLALLEQPATGVGATPEPPPNRFERLFASILDADAPHPAAHRCRVFAARLEAAMRERVARPRDSEGEAQARKELSTLLSRLFAS